MTKFIFVTGGVVSSVGKGITTACLGRLLKDRGLEVAMQKIDPYLNVDAGTMSPFQHGEVFVTDDGAETDLDLGHYERFVDINLTQLSNVTTGQVYGAVIRKERAGEYLGQTVQVIPHLTDEIKSRVYELAEQGETDVLITEIGGTVGDIEGQPFLEAIRQMRRELGAENTLFIHVTLIPYVGPSGESKTKPTQHSVRELRNIGIQPDILLCRSRRQLSKEMREKLSLFCDVAPEAVIEGLDTESIYELPLIFEDQGFGSLVAERLGVNGKPDHTEWKKVVQRVKNPKHHVAVAMVGKYMALQDAYISITEAIKHGGIANGTQVDIQRVDAEDIETHGAKKLLEGVHGIVVPGGYGDRGVEGKIMAIQHAREAGLPFLGLCLGMQCAVIEFARNVCGWKDANSAEFDPDTEHPVLDLLPEQEGVTDRGATQRLGAYPMRIMPGTNGRKVYGSARGSERHRHRYEVNNKFRPELEDRGLVTAGVSPDGKLVELIELPDHPFFLGSQFHPEFKSRPTRAHPLFREFVKAALGHAG
ncbi:MAG: CTP synthase [Armatimonadota bacterium]|nr:MAG: CTP synthase [Armatimonadota bacterium]